MLKIQKYCIGIVISSGLLSFRPYRRNLVLCTGFLDKLGMTCLLTKCHLLPFGLLFDISFTKQ